MITHGAALNRWRLVLGKSAEASISLADRRLARMDDALDFLYNREAGPDVRRDREGLQTMRTLGENMAWLLKCIEVARANGVEQPVYEPRMRTHFIQPK